jgi:hypothetical protein
MRGGLVHHRALGRGLVFALLLGANLGPALAQQTPKQHSSPIARQIILPPRVVASTQATLAVLDAQGRLLPNVAVELTNTKSVTTDQTGRAQFRTPDQPGTLGAKVSGQALAVTAASTIVASDDAFQPGGIASEGSSPQVSSYPHVLAIHDRFGVDGSGFHGAADSNHISLNGIPCLVVAASPVSLVMLPGPNVPIGDVKLRVLVGGFDAGEFPVSAVLLEINGPTEAVSAGSASKLTVRVLGSSQPLAVEVRNGSPAVIQLSKGNAQRVKTSGGDRNVAPIDVQFVTAGDYSISARLVPAEAASPDLELARRRLTEARKIASGGWSARIDKVLLKMDNAPRDLPQIRAELKSMLADKPDGPLASLLDSAWRELN